MAKHMKQKPHKYASPLQDTYWIIGIIGASIIAIITFMGVSTANYAKTPEQCRDEAMKCFELINQERISNGISPLIWDDRIEEKSIVWSQYMIDNDYYEHSTTKELEQLVSITPWEAFNGYNEENNYSECLMVGNDGERAYHAWHESPLHHMAIMATNIERGAVGIASKTNKLWFYPYGVDSYATFQAY